MSAFLVALLCACKAADKTSVSAIVPGDAPASVESPAATTAPAPTTPPAARLALADDDLRLIVTSAGTSPVPCQRTKALGSDVQRPSWTCASERSHRRSGGTGAARAPSTEEPTSGQPR